MKGDLAIFPQASHKLYSEVPPLLPLLCEWPDVIRDLPVFLCYPITSPTGVGRSVSRQVSMRLALIVCDINAVMSQCNWYLSHEDDKSRALAVTDTRLGLRGLIALNQIPDPIHL